MVGARPIVGILLAAGRGQRFDPTGQANKLLARLPSGQSVLAATLRTFASVLERVVVVVPPGAEALRQALDSVEQVNWVVNVRAREGMGTSIAAGVRACPDAAGWLVALGDMPFVQADTVARLVLALRQGDSEVAAPTYDDQRGHPVAFAANLYSELERLEGDEGARRILRTHHFTAIPVADSGILRDIDSPTDLLSNP